MQEKRQIYEKALGKSIGRIAGILSSDRFPTGERAALRRMVPGHVLPLSFYRFAFQYLPSNWERSLDDWTAIVAGIALMSPNANNPRISLGQALSKSGYSEFRLERLLASERGVRRILFLRTIRFLKAKSNSFNWLDGAQFLLTQDEGRRERLNLRIAREFYTRKDKE